MTSHLCLSVSRVVSRSLAGGYQFMYYDCIHKSTVIGSVYYLTLGL